SRIEAGLAVQDFEPDRVFLQQIRVALQALLDDITEKALLSFCMRKGFTGQDFIKFGNYSFGRRSGSAVLRLRIRIFIRSCKTSTHRTVDTSKAGRKAGS